MGTLLRDPRRPENRVPLYDYRCKTCQKTTEVRHGFGETFQGVCPACGGPMARVFNAAGIVFKGSGFYVNDSRAAASKAAKASKPADNAASKPADGAAPASDAAPSPEKSAAPSAAESSTPAAGGAKKSDTAA
jgi:putative FmdB family regulatory protein